MAVVGAPLGKPRWVQSARAARVSDGEGRTLAAEEIADAIERGLAVGHIDRTPQGFECAATHRFAAFREAATATRRLYGWQRTVLDILGKKPDVPWVRPRFGQSVALIRFTLCAGLHEQQAREVLARIGDVDMDALYVEAFASPFDADIARRIATTHRAAVAQAVLPHLLRKPQSTASQALDWAHEIANSPGAPTPLKYRLCEHFLWRGEPDRIASILGEENEGQVVALRAAVAMLNGDPRGSIELYAQAEKALSEAAKQLARSLGRGGTRFGPAPLPPSIAFLRVAALVAVNEPQTLAGARHLCRREASAAQAPSTWYYIDEALKARETNFELHSRLPLSPGDALSALMAVTAGAWAGVSIDEQQQEIVAGYLEAYRAAGYARAAAELDTGLAIVQGRPWQPTQPPALAALFAHEAPWQRVIAALESLAGNPRRSGPAGEGTRIIWVLITDPLGGITVEPREQKRTTRGWSSGRRLSSLSMAQTSLSAHDERVLQALGEDSRYLVPYSAGIHRALAALAGHPLVFFAEDLSTPVDLVCATPELLVERRADGGAQLKLPPELRQHLCRNDYGIGSSFMSGTAERCILLRESTNRARVVRVTSAQRRIAELIGAGLEFPPEAVDALSHTLASITRHFEIHTDIETTVTETPGDATIHAELTPAGAGLCLRLAVRPFGEGGPRYAPGAGGRYVLAQIGGTQRAALRDLRAERDGAMRLAARLGLSDAGEAASEWDFEDPESCLQVVETLQALDAEIRVAWPAGKPIRVTRAYRTSELRVAIESHQDWFSVGGELTLDDGTVMQMRTLIELARASGGRYLPLGEAGFLTLTVDLKRRLEELGRVADIEDAGLRVPALAAGLVAETLEGTMIDSTAEWQARIARLRESQALDVRLPSTLQAELRPYQYEGFVWMARLAHWGAGACLADDMGLGKTVQTIALLLHRASAGAALVIAPTSVCPNWVAELRRFAPTLNVWLLGAADRQETIARAGEFDVIVCSYGLLAQELAALGARAWHTLVLDEAQAVKNFSTRRAQAVLGLSADFRLATTGTPVENRLEELWMLFHFLNPGLLGSRDRFSARFVTPIERQGDAHARMHLRRLISPFMLRRTKAAVLQELPERTEIVLTVEPSPAERAFYAALRDSALDAITDSALAPAQRRFQVLTELMRLRRACCDPRLVVADGAPTGAKLETFAGLAQELAANRHKALVFSQFVGYLKLLRGRLDALGLSYQYLDGSTPASERARSIRAFQAGEGEFFLISLRAGGVGLNLTAADYVIIADPWWNPAVEEQAVGRAHRLGQQRPVTVYRLVIGDSIEERIMALHRDKRTLAEGLFEDEEFGRALSVEELTELLRGG